VISPKSLALLGAPVLDCDEFRDAPLYKSVLVAPRHYSLAADLRGTTAAFNDDVSLSGYHVLREWLAREVPSLMPDAPASAFFSRWVRTGGHVLSLGALQAGRADCAAIDVLVWLRTCATQPELCEGLHVLDDAVLATSASQPFVAGKHVPRATRERLSKALCALHLPSASTAATHPTRRRTSARPSALSTTSQWPAALSYVRRFARVADTDYDSTRRVLQGASGIDITDRIMDDVVTDGTKGTDERTSAGRRPPRFC